MGVLHASWSVHDTSLGQLIGGREKHSMNGRQCRDIQ